MGDLGWALVLTTIAIVALLWKVAVADEPWQQTVDCGYAAYVLTESDARSENQHLIRYTVRHDGMIVLPPLQGIYTDQEWEAARHATRQRVLYMLRQVMNCPEKET